MHRLSPSSCCNEQLEMQNDQAPLSVLAVGSGPVIFGPQAKQFIWQPWDKSDTHTHREGGRERERERERESHQHKYRRQASLGPNSLRCLQCKQRPACCRIHGPARDQRLRFNCKMHRGRGDTGMCELSESGKANSNLYNEPWIKRTQ